MSNDAPAPDVIPSQYRGEQTISSLAVDLKVDASTLPNGHLDSLMLNWRASCYIATAQIFLARNALLSSKLSADDIKPRLLGHYGTTGGLAMAYSHTQALIRRKGEAEGTEPKALFVTGPGHGAPAILSQLYIEGAMSKFYPKYSQTEEGFNRFVRDFSWPGGMPSHVNAETPGCIHEGGELGYALAVAYGSVFDNPDLISVVVVGDGESETGPTATAWHSHKWLDPKESGAVLPILHVNGFKISERTIPGTMDKNELALLYSGYGYQVRFVDYIEQGEAKMGGHDAADVAVHENMAVSLDWAYSEIRKIQEAARSGKPIDKPRWPMIIMRTPKGWTGPATDHNGTQLLNNFASHQVPLPKAKTDAEQLAHLEQWLKSYKPEDFFNKSTSDVQNESLLNKKFYDALPLDVERRLGFVKEAYNAYEPLQLSDWKKFGYEKGKEDVSCMKAIGKYLSDTISNNQTSLRIFSPDELASNKLDGVFETTNRNFQWDPLTAHDGGRVTEMLSEHTLQGWMQGYVLTGRHGIFPSYEAFLGIIATMMVQYSKFNKMAFETNWRGKVSSLNYIETSTWTRQEHNGYSHQNPGFISSVLQLPVHMARVYFPADANTSVSVMAHCLKSTGYVNLIVGTKAPSPVYLTVEEADAHCIAGASIWQNYSTDKGVDPDVVLVGIGYELTQEIIATAQILKKDFGDDLRVRVVNVVDLLVLAQDHPHALSEAGFNSLFPPRIPVVTGYHGYAGQLASLLFDRPHSVGRSRFSVQGYNESGTTTTPYLMMVANKCDRYNQAIKTLEMVSYNYNTDGNIVGDSKRARLGKVIAKVQQQMAIYASKNREMERYANETQQDHPDIGAVEVNVEG